MIDQMSKVKRDADNQSTDQKDFCVSEESTGDADPLTLSSGHASSLESDRRLEPLREGVDKVEDARVGACGSHLFR